MEFNRGDERVRKKRNYWKFISFILFILIIVILLVTYRGYQESIKLINASYISGIDTGIKQGINIGLNQCPSCPTCSVNACESPDQIVLNIASQQTDTGNIVLYNGSHVVSLPIQSLCNQLKNGTIPK